MIEKFQSTLLTRKLKDITHKIQYGYTTSASFKENGNYKFLRITDIQEQGVNWEGVPFAEGLDDENVANKYLLQQGDIVFARTGATTGKSYLLGECQFPTVFASYLIRVRPNESIINPKFLYLFFQSSSYWAQIEKNKKGAAQAGVNASVLGELDIPVPSIEEQEKIIMTLEKAQSLVRKRKTQISTLSSLSQSLFYEMFGDPRINPKGYEEELLGSLTTHVSSGSTPRGGQKSYLEEGIPLIRSQNVLMNHLDLEGVAYISAETHQNMNRSKVQNKDVLFNITGASIGRVTVYTGKDNGANVNQHVCIIRVNTDKLNPYYLSYYLSSYHFQSGVKENNSGATREAFNYTQIKNFKILLPNIYEQNKFENRVLLIERKSLLLLKSLNQLENLFDSLMQSVFKGELHI